MLAGTTLFVVTTELNKTEGALATTIPPPVELIVLLPKYSVLPLRYKSFHLWVTLPKL